MKLCVRILSTAVAIISGLTATAVTPDSIAGKMINVTDISAAATGIVRMARRMGTTNDL